MLESGRVRTATCRETTCCRASSTSPTSGWPRRSAGSRSAGATDRVTSPWWPLVAPAGSILDIEKVLVPADAGLLSALGLGYARIERFAERQILRPLEEVEEELISLIDDLEEEATAAVVGEGVSWGEVEIRHRQLNMRFAGQDSTLTVELGSSTSLGDSPSLGKAFLEAYEEHYGYRPERRQIELESLRVVASAGQMEVEAVAESGQTKTAPPVAWRKILCGGEWRLSPIYDRDSLESGARLKSPAVVVERHSATVIEPGWQGRVDGAGCLVLERRGK